MHGTRLLSTVEPMYFPLMVSSAAQINLEGFNYFTDEKADLREVK